MEQKVEHNIPASPRISVIIPVYNVKKYLNACLESIVKQTYRKLEIIIVDDGSTDGSGTICDEYKEKYDNITVIHQSNGGLSAARNTGLKIASGDYISFIDSDDFISHYYFEIVAKIILMSNIELIAIEHPVMFWDGEEGNIELAHNEDDYSAEYMDSISALEKMFYLKIATGAQFKVIKRDRFNKVEFPVSYVYEDVATTYKEFLNVERVAIISGKLYAYRKREGSIIRQKFTPNKLGIIDISHWIVDDIDNRCPTLSSAVRYRVFSPLFSVYLQVPKNEKTYLHLLWTELTKYRKDVVKSIGFGRKKDVFAALISLFGMNISYYLGNRFGRRESIK